MTYGRLLSFLARALLLVGLVTTTLGACGDPATGTLVVGVTSDYGDLTEVQITMKVDDQTLKDDRERVGNGATSFPAEYAFNDVEEGQQLSFTLRGFDGSGTNVVTRHMTTEAVAGGPKLVRVHLETQCRIGPSGGAPTCDEDSQTCIGGVCASAEVATSEQEDYSEDWAGGSSESDVCKEAGAGPPEVHVGAGQSDYFAIEDYAEAQIEAGPQGGHHIWIAARIKNLKQSGSITEVGAEIPSLGLSITPLKVIFTFDPDEGGYCKIFGLRLQLDIDGDDINTMLGQEAKVVMSITDVDDDVGTGEKWVTLSDSIL